MIIENGTGVEGADSYASVEDAVAYHELRGNAFEGTTSQKAAALVRATDYIDAHYTPLVDRGRHGLRFAGCHGFATVRKATIELAVHAIDGSLFQKAARGIASQEEEIVGAITTSITYDAAPEDPFPFVTAMLAPVAALNGGAVIQMRKLSR